MTYELFSFIFWTLILIPLLKYALLLLAANDDGEDVPVPTACVILISLFTLQHYWTHKIGFLFAPIITIWILFISGMGLYNLFRWNDHIIYVINPIYMFRFIKKIDISSWKLLGSIALCIAGSEAMFADLGHFSKKSIKVLNGTEGVYYCERKCPPTLLQVTFICLVYPTLVLCYAGQAAYISRNMGSSEDVIHLSESVNESCRKPSNHHRHFLYYKPMPGTWLLSKSKSHSYVR